MKRIKNISAMHLKELKPHGADVKAEVRIYFPRRKHLAGRGDVSPKNWRKLVGQEMPGPPHLNEVPREHDAVTTRRHGACPD